MVVSFHHPAFAMYLSQNNNGANFAWRGEQIPRLVLGTAQLGLAYGVANRTGKPSIEQAAALVETAWRAGFHAFDTAQAYGDSETVLGECLRRAGIAAEALVITKVAPALATDPAGLVQAVSASRERLGIETLWGVMLHGVPPCPPEMLRNSFDVLREAGAKHVGISVYALNEAEPFLDLLDIVQLPANAWDPRAWSEQWLAKLHGRGVLPFVRSALLQGLLALSPGEVSQHVPEARAASEDWHALAEAWGMPPQEVALRFALSFDAPLVLGAEQPEQVVQLAAAAAKGPLTETQLALVRQTATMWHLPARVYDPRLWKQTP
jgi:aryl-alcohol dehydrogenase-like predicted oxidoreductase